MPELIDRIFFRELAAMSTEDVCNRAACAYSGSEHGYTLPLWDRPYQVRPDLMRVGPVDPAVPPLHPYLELFLIHYLLRAEGTEPTGRWISEKDIPGGSTFFRGPHAIPTDLITSRFGNDIELFNKRCEELEGTSLSLADAAWRFPVTPRIPVAVLYWRGDDEFPAEAKLLFDAGLSRQMAPDVVYALAVGVCDRLGRETG